MYKTLERGIIDTLKEIAKNIECCAFLACVSFSIIISVLLYINNYSFNIDKGLDFYNAMVGFGIASLSFLSSHINYNSHLQKAVCAIFINIFMSLIAIAFCIFDCNPALVNTLLPIFILVWSLHCTLHIVSLCLIKNNR